MPVDRDREVYQRDNFKCQYCDFDGSSFPAWEFLVIDHFKPRWNGGSDDPENLITACIRCNQIKGVRKFRELAAARASIQKTWAEMRTHWEMKVRPLVIENRKKSN